MNLASEQIRAGPPGSAAIGRRLGCFLFLLATLSLPLGLCAQSPAPPISRVAGPSAGSYRTGQNLNFTVNFSTAVTVTGTPQLPLIIGSTRINATYVSGSPGTALVFTYNVQLGDTDSDGITAVSPFTLAGGTIRTGGTDATLTFTLPDTTTVLVDTTPPTVSIGPPSVSRTSTGPVSYTVTYADIGFRFSVLDVPDVVLRATGTADGVVAVTGSGMTRTVTISGISGEGTLGISIAAGTAYDVAGNSAPSAGPSAVFAVKQPVPNAAPSFALNGGVFSSYNTNRVTAWGTFVSSEGNIPAGLSATAIAAGFNHGLAVQSDGTVVAWGQNSDGQTTVPAGLSGVSGVAAGQNFSVALKSDGTVAGWGLNDRGQLNLPVGLTDAMAIKAGLYHGLALQRGGTVVAWGGNAYGQATVPAGLSGVVAIAAGGLHNLALKSDGTVVAWGFNGTLAASVPAGLGTVVAVAASFYHSVALKDDGTVVAWGLNLNGQTTVPAGLTRVVAIAAGISHSAALKSDGAVVEWGRNVPGEVSLPASLRGVTAIESGYAYYTLGRYTEAIVSVLEDAGAYTTNHLVENIFSGPVGEDPQTVSLVVKNDNPALFSVQPAIDAAGTFTFTAAPDASGMATVSLVARDDGGTANGGVDTSAARSFTIAITPVNDAPTTFLPTNRVLVVEDSGDYRNFSFALFSAGPANESDQRLTVSASNDNPGLFRAAPVVTAGGLLTFTPAPNSNGMATVTLIVQDDGGTANGGVDRMTNTFTITVLPVNDPPTIGLATNQVVVLEDSGAYRNSLASFTTGPTNETGQGLTVTTSNNNPALFSTPPMMSTNGVLTFTPAADANGVAIVTIVAQDDGGTANGGVIASTNAFTIAVTPVNDAPTLAPMANPAAILEDAGPQTINLRGISAGGNESQTLTVVATSSNPSVIPHPTVTYTSPTATGSLTYAPAANANGTAVITVVVRDDGGRANGGVDAVTNQFTVMVVAVNDPPTVALATNQVTVLEDSGGYTNRTFAVFTVGPADEVAARQSITNVTILSVTNAALFSAGPSLNSTGELTFTPTPNANGTALVTFIFRDDGGTHGGGVDTTTNTFLITVTSVNDGPRVSFAQDPLGVGQDSGAHAMAGFATFSAGPPNELSQRPVSYAVTVDNASLFSAAPAISRTGLLTFTPAVGVHGAARVTVVVQDEGGNENGGVDQGTNTFSITVATAGNTVPTLARPIRDFSVSEDGGNVVTNLATVFADMETPAAGLSYRVVENTNAALVTATISEGTNLVLAFASDGFGASRIGVSARDDGGLGVTNTFVVTVNPVNHAPSVTLATNQVAVLEDSGPITSNRFAAFSPGPFTESAQTVSVLSVANDNHALFRATPAIDDTGRLTFTPAAHSNGVAVVTVVVQDSGGRANGGVDQATNIFTITITAVNDAPTIALATNNVVVLEDSGAYRAALATFTAGPANESAQALTITTSDNNSGLFLAVPNVSLGGVLTFTPAANSNGMATVTIIAQDNGGTENGGADRTTNTFTINVTPVNDAPAITLATNNVVVLEDAGARTVAGFATFSAGPPNENARTLVGYTLSNNNPGLFSAAPTIDNTGKLTFTPAANSNGVTTVTVVVQDSGGTANGGVE
ncbi:hypothetical protein LBMAG56_34130 [Verrucomicrobiota bacterium]|nr:hypothetical protein LBMAG56_34130 [Verrucomicrobiota bacterium]